MPQVERPTCLRNKHPSGVVGSLPDKGTKYMCLLAASLRNIFGATVESDIRNKGGGSPSSGFSRGGDRGYKL